MLICDQVFQPTLFSETYLNTNCIIQLGGCPEVATTTRSGGAS